LPAETKTQGQLKGLLPQNFKHEKEEFKSIELEGEQVYSFGGKGRNKKANFFPKAVKLSKLNRRKEMIR